MARVKIPLTVINPTTGVAVANASIEVRHRSSNALATLYQAETGGTTVANPTTTDANGRSTAWVERGGYRGTISGTGLTTYSQDFDAAPGGDGTIDTPWVGDQQVTRAKIAPAGLKTARSASTALAAGATIAVSLTWPTAFPNTNYTVAIAVVDANSRHDLRGISSKTATGITVALVSNSGSSTTVVVEAIAWAD